MIPLRAVIESMGMSIDFCTSRQAIIINQSGGSIQMITEDWREFERRVLELTNIERANHGLQPVVWQDNLAAAARAHSTDMAVRGFAGHICPDGGTPGMRAREHGFSQAVTENIAWGQTTPEQVVEWWMNSPGHRANILTPTHRHLGVGVFSISGFYMFLWTQKFN